MPVQPHVLPPLSFSPLFCRASHLAALWQRPAGVLLHPWPLERGGCESPLPGTSPCSSSFPQPVLLGATRFLGMTGAVPAISTASSIPTLTVISPTHFHRASMVPSPVPTHCSCRGCHLGWQGKPVPRHFQRLCSYFLSLGRSQHQVDANPSRLRCAGRK